MSRVVAWRVSPSASAKPIRKWASIMPELPRAPRTAARAAVRAVSGSGASPSTRSASATARRVRLKLVPVSPSGTGNTLMRLISSRPAATQSAAANNERERRGPSRYAMPTVIGAGLLGHHRQPQLCMHLGMKPDGDGVGPQGLDRVLQLDLAPVHHLARALERGGDVLGGNRPEELALLAGLAAEREVQ